MIPYNLFFTFPATIDQDGIHAERGRACVAICTTSSMITISVYLIALVRFLLAELMIGTTISYLVSQPVPKFQSPISGVNDWNLSMAEAFWVVDWMFQSPISGVNDWNTKLKKRLNQAISKVSVSY